MAFTASFRVTETIATKMRFFRSPAETGMWEETIKTDRKQGSPSVSKIQIYSQTAPFSANAEDTDYILGFGNTIYSAGIDGASNVFGRTFLINGEIQAGAFGIAIGTSPLMRSSSVDITVGDTGHINATQFAVRNYSDASEVINTGVITGLGTGIYSEGDKNHFNNSGVISVGEAGIHAFGNGTHILNSGMISADFGIRIVTTSGEKSTVINSGTISGGWNERAISGGYGDDKVINSGKIAGDVLLFDGDDIYISRGGIATGHIYGYGGNDTYVLDRRGVRITEFAGEGTDTVKSSVGWTLGDNFENLSLLGAKNSNGNGNDLGNVIAGNAGSNKLTGGAGDDTLSGGKGNDRLDGGNGVDGLTGGRGADTFVFKTGYGGDTVQDFENGIDHFDLKSWNAVTSFTDLKTHHLAVAGDDLVITSGADTLIIRDTAKGELDAGDFLF